VKLTTTTKRASTPVAVISERLARTCFGKENPVGRRITFVDENRDLEIVGVSANVRYGGLKEDESPMTVFVAASQSSPDGMTYALRTAGDPLSYVKSVYEIVRKADSRIPVTNVLTQGRKSIGRSARKPRSRNYARLSRFSLS
jgi:hypothetical protein